MHPTDWQDSRLLKDSTGPVHLGLADRGRPERIWGLPVAQSDVIAQGTALAATSRPTPGWRCAGHRRAGQQQPRDLLRGGQAGHPRGRQCALVVYRPAALCTVTGL